MSRSSRNTLAVFGVLFGLSVWTWQPLAQTPAAPPAQSTVPPSNDAPNPYQTIEGYFKMPEGRTWGSTSAVDIDRDGKSIWVAERCGRRKRQLLLVRRQDVAARRRAEVRSVRQAGPQLRRRDVRLPARHPRRSRRQRVGHRRAGQLAAARTRRAGGCSAASAAGDQVVGHQVIKFSPEGKVLLTLGKAGGNRPGEPADPSSFYQPNDVITNAAGEIFVAEGHVRRGDRSAHQQVRSHRQVHQGDGASAARARASSIQPHALAWDSKGRLFVADRGNNRIQIFDQDCKLLETGWEQYSRISGLWIDKNDMLYAADSESGSVAPPRKDWKRGHPHRQHPGRQGRQDSGLHPGPINGYERHPRGRGRGRGRRGKHLWRRSRPASPEEICEEVNRPDVTWCLARGDA